MSIHVIYNYCTSSHPQRQQEYDLCVLKNAQNPHVSTCHVFVENNDKEALNRVTSQLDALVQRKIRQVPIERQMLYSDAFRYANDNLQGEVVVIQNADIYIEDDKTAGETAEKMTNLRNVALALTRHEHDKCNHVRPQCNCPFMQSRYIGSHDSIWFVAPVDDAVVARVQHKQNMWGAENNVIVALESSGMTVKNPSRDVRVYHVHKSGFRPWFVPYRPSTALATAAMHSHLMQTTIDF